MSNYRGGEYPTVVIEKDVPVEMGRGQWRGGMIQHFYDQVIGMDIGDSFMIEVERYATAGVVHAAFKKRSWKARMKTVKIARENKGLWKLRFWRIA